MHHPSELTYYDELGVPNTAAAEEVRDSFRALVRIVHPDHQTDPQLKEIAEKQMRKLNRIYAVLSDPDKRRRYDESLERSFGPTIVLSPGTTLNVRRIVGRIAWVAAAVLTVISLIWLSTDSPAAHMVQPDRAPQPAAQVVHSPAPSEEIEHLRQELRTTKIERDYALRELQELRGSAQKNARSRLPDPVVINPSPIPATLTELPSASLPPAAPPVAAAPVRVQPQRTAARTFSGFWFYSRQTDPAGKVSTLYPPEYIEATLTEQNGVITGKYRSRYKIPDRAISPDVIFEFSGTATGNTLTAPWVGNSGSRARSLLKCRVKTL